MIKLSFLGDIMNTIKQFYEEELAATGGLKCGILQSMDDPDLSNKGSRAI